MDRAQHCLSLAVILFVVSCAPGRAPTSVPSRLTLAAPSVPPPTFTPVSSSVALLTPTPTIAGPNIGGLERMTTVNGKGEPVIVYKNAAGKTIATLNPRDPFHNRQIAWDWKQVLGGPDMDIVVREMFDPEHLTFAGSFATPEAKKWITSALMKWAPQVSQLQLPNSAAIRAHYPGAESPSPEIMFEALSRIKTVSGSESGVSYGGFEGEVRLSQAASPEYPAAYGRVSTPEQMNLFAFAITVKEASVIAWAQDHNLVRGCVPDDPENPVEYYSTTWLVMTLKNLAPRLQGADKWILNTTVPFYEGVLESGDFPPCGS